MGGFLVMVLFIGLGFVWLSRFRKRRIEKVVDRSDDTGDLN